MSPLPAFYDQCPTPDPKTPRSMLSGALTATPSGCSAGGSAMPRWRRTLSYAVRRGFRLVTDTAFLALCC